MKESTLELRPAPQFLTGINGTAAAVTLHPVAYIALLVKANVTDPALWPPGTQHGAAALARVRAIEKRCIARHGEFDWEKLSPKVQDEYDGLCSVLDGLMDTGERISLQELLRKRGKEPA